MFTELSLTVSVCLWKCTECDCLQPNGILSNRLQKHTYTLTNTHTQIYIQVHFPSSDFMPLEDVDDMHSWSKGICLHLGVSVCVCVFSAPYKALKIKPKYVETLQLIPPALPLLSLQLSWKTHTCCFMLSFNVCDELHLHSRLVYENVEF